MVKYSVVVPFYNEEHSVEPLYEKLKAVFTKMDGAYELIFVDDGSTDETPQRLNELASADSVVNVIRVEPNRGQTEALRAGFEKAAGEVAISMDGDLQNDPADIPDLVRKIGKGYDFVCGWRRNRKDPVSKKIASWFGNFAQRNIFKSNLHDISCTLRVYKAEAVKDLTLKRRGSHRFIPYLLMMNGKRGGEAEVNHLHRPYGTSKYGFSRSFKVLRDFLILLVNRKAWM